MGAVGWAAALSVLPALLGATSQEPAVAVRLEGVAPAGSVPVRLCGPWRALGSDGAVLLEGTELEGELAVDALGARLGAWRIQSEEFRVQVEGDAALRLRDRSFRGSLRVLLVRDERTDLPAGLDLRLELPLEEYVLGVLCGEMATTRPGVGEALRAQAVVARSYALWRLRSGARYLWDDSRDQRFLSVDYETEAARRAVASTAGLVLTWDGKVLPAFYHADCGGHTADAEAAGFLNRAFPPLRGAADPGCEASREWEEIVPAARLDALAQKLGLGEWLERVEVARASAGWCVEARAVGPDGSRRFRGEELRAALGLRSSRWRSLQGLDDGSLRIRGTGRGHGVGMCQAGALRRAAEGQNAEAILQHYYPGARLVSITEVPGGTP